MSKQATPGTSFPLALVIAVTTWPSFLLLALDIYGLHGWISGCRSWQEPVGAGALAFLLCATAVMMACLLRNLRSSLRLGRSIRHMPLLDDRETAMLHGALPGLKEVTVRVYERDEPQAFTVGWWSPTIVLSRWLLENLDRQEILAAVAHELAHVRHRDNWLLFWVHILCSGGLGRRLFHRQLRHLTMLIESRADAAGAAMAGDPLALASALIKVRRALGPANAATVSSLAGDVSLLRSRVATLLGDGEPARRFHRSSAWLLAALAIATTFLVSYAHTLPCAGTECERKGMAHLPSTPQP